MLRDKLYTFAYSSSLRNFDRKTLTGIIAILIAVALAVVLLIAQTLTPPVQVVSAEATGISESYEDETEAASETEIYVHVTGAVKLPGVYSIPEGSRLADAVEAAGGFDENASQSSVNLARIAIDGEQIRILTIDEANRAEATTTDGGATVASSVSAKVNLNTATSEQLQTLSGIGESTAAKIIADREKNGPFSEPHDITRVSGIGEKKYEAIAEFITV